MNWSRMLNPLRNAINLMVGRAVLIRVDDAAGIQILQLGLLAKETRSGIERFQEYGLSTVPLAAAEVVVVFVGGKRSNGFAVAVDDRRYRPRNQNPGDVTLYSHLNLNTPHHLHLDSQTGDVVIGAGSSKITMQPSGRIAIEGDVSIDGNVNVHGNITATGRIDDEGGNTPHHSHT